MRIAFIGTGIMGAPMAANLVRAGHDVHSYARGPAGEARAIAAGAICHPTPLEAVESAETIITMLPDGPDVRGLMLDAGLLDAVVRGALYIDMSSISPAVSRDIALRANELGVGALDAPVSGGEAAAIDGTLSVMVGGTSTDFERGLRVLQAMGSNITHVGPSGAGQTTKAANQLIVASNILAVSEAIVFLEESGVDLEAALSAIATGLAGSAVLDRKRTAFLTGQFTPGFRAILHRKDLRILRTAADAAGLALPLGSLVSAMMSSLVAQGRGQDDHSALLWLTRALNGKG